MKENIPIVFITDDNYALPTGVAICSLIQNLELGEILEIYIIYSELSKKNQELLVSCGNYKTDVKLIYFDASNYEDFRSKNVYVPPTSLIKFELPNILTDYPKVLYLDGDIIVQGDVKNLFEVVLNDCYCAAVQDYESCKNYLSCERLKLKKYYNSGVMLLNLNKMRKDNLSKKMFEIKRKRKDLYYMDQDVLNLAFDNKVIELPVKYNCILNSYRGADVTIKEINAFFNEKYMDYEEFIENADILHLAGGNKPWKSKKGICYDQWIKYYHESPMTTVELENLKNKKNKFHNIKRKIFINQKGLLQTDYFWGFIYLGSKVRTEEGIKYFIGKKR